MITKLKVHRLVPLNGTRKMLILIMFTHRVYSIVVCLYSKQFIQIYETKLAKAVLLSIAIEENVTKLEIFGFIKQFSVNSNQHKTIPTNNDSMS